MTGNQLGVSGPGTKAMPTQRTGMKVPKKGSGSVQLAGLMMMLVALFTFWPLAIVGLIIIVMGSVSARAVMCSVCGNGVDEGSALCPTCHATLLGTKGRSSVPTWILLLVFLASVGWLVWSVTLREQIKPEVRGPGNETVNSGGVVLALQRGAELSILAVGPDGTAGTLRTADGREAPSIVADLEGKKVGDVWTGSLYRCGSHTFPTTGRIVDRYAVSRKRALELINP